MAFARQSQGLNSIVLQGGQNVFGKAFYGFTLNGDTGTLEVTKVIDGTAVYTTDGNLRAESDYEAWAYTLNKLVFSFNNSGHLLLEVR
jgi:hypothetical protein